MNFFTRIFSSPKPAKTQEADPAHGTSTFSPDAPPTPETFTRADRPVTPGNLGEPAAAPKTHSTQEIAAMAVINKGIGNPWFSRAVGHVASNAIPWAREAPSFFKGQSKHSHSRHELDKNEQAYLNGDHSADRGDKIVSGVIALGGGHKKDMQLALEAAERNDAIAQAMKERLGASYTELRPRELALTAAQDKEQGKSAAAGSEPDLAALAEKPAPVNPANIPAFPVEPRKKGHELLETAEFAFVGTLTLPSVVTRPRPYSNLTGDAPFNEHVPIKDHLRLQDHLKGPASRQAEWNEKAYGEGMTDAKRRVMQDTFLKDVIAQWEPGLVGDKPLPAAARDDKQLALWLLKGLQIDEHRQSRDLVAAESRIDELASRVEGIEKTIATGADKPKPVSAPVNEGDYGITQGPLATPGVNRETSRGQTIKP